MAKLWSLQVMRFVAALLVAHYHATAMVETVTGRFSLLGAGGSLVGRCGVDLFFVISGFIITRTSAGLTAGQFVERRAKRILPLYLVCAAVAVGLASVSGSLDGRKLLATLLLWPATEVMTEPLVPAAWTLCFEVVFYAAAALVIWKPRAAWLVGAAYLAALALRSNPALQFLGNPLTMEFLLGVGLAFLPSWRPARLALPLGAALLIAGAVLNLLPPETALISLVGDNGWVRLLVLGLPSALVIWGALQFEARPGFLTTLGDASYSHYLFHIPLVTGVALVLARVPGLPVDLIVLACITISLLVSWRIYELFEKPLLALLKRPRLTERAA